MAIPSKLGPVELPYLTVFDTAFNAPKFVGHISLISRRSPKVSKIYTPLLIFVYYPRTSLMIGQSTMLAQKLTKVELLEDAAFTLLDTTIASRRVQRVVT